MARPAVRLPLPVKILIPVGAGLDISTGYFIRGTHDQYVLNGGVGAVTGAVGPGNSNKTTITRFMEFSALSKVIHTCLDDTWGITYDTETNAHENRQSHLAAGIRGLDAFDIIGNKIWQLTDRTEYSGDEAYMLLKKALIDKRKDKRAKLYPTAFLNREGGVLETLPPTFSDIDSLTKFTSENVDKTLEGTMLSDSKNNTAFMQAGLAKTKMLGEIPSLCSGAMHYFFFTAHIGKSGPEMGAGPGTPPPRKQLQGMPQGEVIKGVTNDFFYLMQNCWLFHSCRPYLNKTTKAPEFPYEPGDEVSGDNDLQIVTLRQLRGKAGGTHYSIEIVVSQRDGVLASLSDFNLIRDENYFGLIGGDKNYHCALYPDVKLSRTTIRKKLREDPKLERAIEIVSQMKQIEQYHPNLKGLMLSPEELYSKITEAGYDWNFILNETRSWHTFDDERAPGWPLSTVDLNRMAQGLYHPYWLEADKKTLKPEYVKKKLEVK